jgi:hypothetical protein
MRKILDKTGFLITLKFVNFKKLSLSVQIKILNVKLKYGFEKDIKRRADWGKILQYRMDKINGCSWESKISSHQKIKKLHNDRLFSRFFAEQCYRRIKLYIDTP